MPKEKTRDEPVLPGSENQAERPQAPGEPAPVEARPVTQRYGAAMERADVPAANTAGGAVEQGLPSDGDPLSGFPVPGGRGVTDRSNQVNPDRDNPNRMDRSKLAGAPASGVYLPNQMSVPVQGEVKPSITVNIPYGSEPQGLDPATGKVIPTPVKDPETVKQVQKTRQKA